MSHDGLEPLVPVGQSPEWTAWFDEMITYFEDRRLPDFEWPPLMISDESLTKVKEAEERERIKREFSSLIRTAARDHAISVHPWDFKP